MSKKICYRCEQKWSGQKALCLKCRKERAILLAEANPRLSIAKIAKHIGLAESTVSKLFDKRGLKKWFTQ
jgi:AraC-like DNA-binding protein